MRELEGVSSHEDERACSYSGRAQSSSCWPISSITLTQHRQHALSKLPAEIITVERIKSFAAFLFEEIAFNTRTGSRPPAGFGALAMSLSKKTLLAMLVGATLTSLYGCGGDDSGGGGHGERPPAERSCSLKGGPTGEHRPCDKLMPCRRFWEFVVIRWKFRRIFQDIFSKL